MQSYACVDSPRVSVLIPVYNAQAYLARCLESILAQSFQDFEIIAVDDGSTDATTAILDDFAVRDLRIKVSRQPHGGVTAALNHGLALARGEFVARMDADDLSLPRRFARQISFLEAHRDISGVGCGIGIINADGRTTGLRKYPCHHTHIVETIDKGGVAFAHSAMMIRRAALLSVGGYRAAYDCAEDYDLWLRMIERFSMANLPELLLLHRKHMDSVSARFSVRQIFAARIAQVAAGKRRAGLLDPSEGLKYLSLREFFLLRDDPRIAAILRCDLAEFFVRAASLRRRHGDMHLALQLFNLLVPYSANLDLDNLGRADALVSEAHVRGVCPIRTVRIMLLLAWHHALSGEPARVVMLLLSALVRYPRGISGLTQVLLGRVGNRLMSGMVG